MINAVPSLPILIDASILAGCGYSVPWVKSLLHKGSVIVSSSHPMFKTYVDDCSNVAAGCGPEVEEVIVQCALAFNSQIVVKRKFKLSPKSAIVSSDHKLACRVAKELADYGMCVQAAHSTRDVGVLFTAGVYRDTMLFSKRISKAKKAFV